MRRRYDPLPGSEALDARPAPRVGLRLLPALRPGRRRAARDGDRRAGDWQEGAPIERREREPRARAHADDHAGDVTARGGGHLHRLARDQAAPPGRHGEAGPLEHLEPERAPRVRARDGRAHVPPVPRPDVHADAGPRGRARALDDHAPGERPRAHEREHRGHSAGLARLGRARDGREPRRGGVEQVRPRPETPEDEPTVRARDGLGRAGVVEVGGEGRAAGAVPRVGPYAGAGDRPPAPVHDPASERQPRLEHDLDGRGPLALARDRDRDRRAAVPIGPGAHRVAPWWERAQPAHGGPVPAHAPLGGIHAGAAVDLEDQAGRAHGRAAPLLDLDPGRRLPGCGRGVTSDVVVADPSLSRRHARFDLRTEGAWQLVDLESANGTRVDLRRIPAGVPALLKPGDLLRLGTLRLVVLLPADLRGSAPAVSTVPCLRLPSDGVTARALVGLLVTSPTLLDRFGALVLLQVPTSTACWGADAADVTSVAATGPTASRDRLGAARVHSLGTVDRAVVGRDLACEVVFRVQGVSRGHATLFRGRHGWNVVDLGSRNGTSLDGAPLTAGLSVPVRAGTVLTFGSYRALLLPTSRLTALVDVVRGG